MHYSNFIFNGTLVKKKKLWRIARECWWFGIHMFDILEFTCFLKSHQLNIKIIYLVQSSAHKIKRYDCLWFCGLYHTFMQNITFQVVNFGSNSVNLKISVSGLDPNSVKLSGTKMTVLTSTNLMDENSFKEPTKVKEPLFPAFHSLFRKHVLYFAQKSVHLCISVAMAFTFLLC